MSDNTLYGSVVEKIISEQEQIIGPIALEQAASIPGLKIDWPNHAVAFDGDAPEIVNQLITRYSNFFGPAAVEVCKDATRDIVSRMGAQQVPSLLR